MPSCLMSITDAESVICNLSTTDKGLESNIPMTIQGLAGPSAIWMGGHWGLRDVKPCQIQAFGKLAPLK